MDAFGRLKSLSSNMEFETAEDVGCQKLTSRQQNAIYVSHAMLPNGKRIPLLKTLLTSACEKDCYYCPFRSGRDFKRATLKPEEMAHAFMAMHRAGVVQGMFLSSGIAGGGVRTQDKLLATSEILRIKHNYSGYLHLKLMPGAEKSQVERAMQLADRVSVNLEAPNTQRLMRLAPQKTFIEQLLQPMRWVEEIRRTQSPLQGWKGHWPSMVTQFVVGAVGDSDLELLSTTALLHQQLNLGRAYFSAFNPVSDTPLEGLPPTPLIRQNRLYQASYLLRDYGFDLEELPFEASGNLSDRGDPKTVWALDHLAESPVELNRAAHRELLRIPGIGLKGAQAILIARRQGKLLNLEDLRKIGINPKRLIPFILLNGKRPERQLVLL